MSFQRDFLSKRITDPLAKKVHDLGKEEYAQNFQVQNIDTLTAQILSIKTKTKTLSKDKFHVSLKSYDPDQRFYNAVYPDRKKLKLWLKGENSDQLHDYSLLNNNAHLWSAYQVAEQYLREDPNNMAGHEIVSHVNGTHYIHVEDDPNLRISDLVVSENTAPGFTIITRFNPLATGNSNQDSKIIEQKIDSSQNRYGHSVNIDDKGNIYFYVRYNYRQYFVKLDAPIVIPKFQANYSALNYKGQNYNTLSQTELEEILDISYDLVCRFNYTTKECTITVLFEDEIISHASSVSGINSIPVGAQLILPLQEGEWSEVKTLPNNLPMNTIFDASTNQLTGTITGSSTGGIWEENNTLKSLGSNVAGTADGISIDFPTITTLDTLTQFSVCFWYNPYNETTNLKSYNTRLVSKGYAVASSFFIERATGVNNLKFAIRNSANNEFSVTVTNPFPVANRWYFVTCKWKSGEPLKISIDATTDITGSNLVTTLSSAANLLKLYNTTRAPIGSMVNLMIFNRQITTLEQIQLFQYGPHLIQLPKNLEPQRLTNPDPTPQTNPISTIYDLPKIGSPTINDYTFINNPSSQNPFVAKYTCPDGTAAAVPLAEFYNITPGSGGTTVNPFVTVYNLPKPSGPSVGQITYSSTASNNEWGYVQWMTINTSVLFNKAFTEIQLWLNGADNPTGGTVWLGIIKNDGTKIKFGASIDPATIPDAWTSYTKQLLTNTYPLALGDGIGVIWEGGTGGSINIHRGGTANHFDVDTNGDPRSCQNGRRGAGAGSWKTENPDYSMAAVLKTGGDTVGTSPYYILKNASGFNILVGEYFPTGSPAIAQTPTKAEFRVYRDTAATNGTISIRHVKADGTYWATLYEVNVNTLPTEAAIPTTFNFTWENFSYSRAIIAGDRIAVVVTGLTTGNAYVLTNIGNSGGANNYDGTRSFLNYRNFAGTFASQTSLDLAGVIRKGGSSFSPIIKFSETVTRIYERAVNASSSFYDQPISRVIIRGKRTGLIPEPSIMTCVLRNSANVEKVTIGTIDANTIGTATLENIQFTNNNNDIKVAAGDYISVGIATCTATNFIELNMNTNVVDAGNSVLGALDNGIIGDLSGYDLAGTFFIGGQIDNVSRKRVAQYIDTQDSIFLTVPNNRVTILDATLVAVGAPSGLIYFNVRRGTDDALISTLGTIAASSITTVLAGTTVHITNFNNTYILAAKDKISIEFEGGDQLNKIGVQIRTATPNYDGINSYISRYNGVEYDYITAKDLSC